MREALKLALDALTYCEALNRDVERQKTQAITAIQEALAQDELCSSQQPVAVYGYCPECGAKGLQRERRPDGFDRCVNGHIYPSSKDTPPKRPWIGLTGLEQKELMAMSAREAVFATEDNLKELNT